MGTCPSLTAKPHCPDPAHCPRAEPACCHLAGAAAGRGWEQQLYHRGLEITRWTRSEVWEERPARGSLWSRRRLGSCTGQDSVPQPRQTWQPSRGKEARGSSRPQAGRCSSAGGAGPPSPQLSLPVPFPTQLLALSLPVVPLESPASVAVREDSKQREKATQERPARAPVCTRYFLSILNFKNS